MRCLKIMLCCLAWAAPAAAQVERVPVETAQLPPELDRVLRDYEAAWGARDSRRLAALFHTDGFVLASGSMPVRGRDAIARHYDNAGGELHLRALAWSAADSVAYIIGAFRGSGPAEAGKFLLALRRDGGRGPWLIAADMDNINYR